MPRVEKTIFISYRRTNLPWALCIYQNLTMHGYDVFFDYQSIDSGNFEKVILENIKTRAHFLVILTPSALERLKEPNDWLRREIETAMDEKRNIIPLMLESFDFGSPLATQALTGKLAALNTYNGLKVYSEYFFEAMDKLRDRYLNVPLDKVYLPELNAKAKAVTEAQTSAASEAPKVEKEELTAQEWFERGYVFQQGKNFNEAIRCYTEGLRLRPEFVIAHNNLGILLRKLKRNEEAEASYRKAIELNPSYATAYSNLGGLLVNLKRYEEAEASVRKALELEPLLPEAYGNLGVLLSRLKRNEEAEASYRKAIELNPSLAEAHNSLGNLLKDLKRNEEAEASYSKAIELNPSYATAYSNLGNLLSDENLKRYEEAEAAYRKAIELNEASPLEENPSYATAYSNLGILLKNLKRYEEAEAAYRKAIELNEASPLGENPSDATAYSNLTILLRVMNKERDALLLLEKLIEVDPEDFNSYIGIASIKKTIGESVEPAFIEKARQYIPEDDFYNKACLESVCDNFDLAFEHLQRATQKEKFNSEWAWEDPDLQWLRGDPRFVEIVGAKPGK